MKKLFSVLFLALTLSMGVSLVSCGDDKDEPDAPKTQSLESVESENEAHFVFDIDVNKDSSSIFIYNVKFSERMPVTVNIRIDAPCKADKTGKIFTFAGTDIIPYLLSGTPKPMPSYLVTNLTSTVNTDNKSFSISFDANGGHYEKAGKLK